MTLKYHKPPLQAVFFDRDDTLVKDHTYTRDPGKVELLPTVGDTLGMLRRMGVLCLVVTNQSGVGRGFMWTSDVYAVHTRLDELLWHQGKGVIHRYFMCFHRPEEQCRCRKPQPLLIEQGMALYGLTPSQCWMIGNKTTDIEAGKKARVNTYLVGDGLEAGVAQGPHLQAWLDLIRGSHSSGSVYRSDG